MNVPGLGQSGATVDIVSAGWETVYNGIGTPLELGSTQVCSRSGCAWGFSAQYLPPPLTGITMGYKGGNFSQLDADLLSIVASNVVITSLDLEPASYAYGISWVQTAQSGGFDYRAQIVTPDQIQSVAAEDGWNSRIITAVSFDAQGLAHLISYGWQADTATVYETQTAIVPPENVAATAIQLANAGYIITAFGGNDSDGYVLIGARVAGDTLPRPVNVTTPSGYTPASHPDSAYFTQVIGLEEPAGVAGAGYTSIQQQ